MRPRTLIIAALAASLMAAPLRAQNEVENAEAKAMSLIDRGDYKGAAPLLEVALKNAQARYGADDPSLAIEMGNLAEVYRHLGRLQQAEDLLLRAVVLDERAGADNAQGLATTLNNLALVYRDQRRLPEAEKAALRSLNLLEKALGPSHPDVARALGNLAAIYQAEGHPERAIPLLKRAITIADKTDGARGASGARYRRQLAEVDPTAAPPPSGPFAEGPTPVPATKPPEAAFAAALAEELEPQPAAPVPEPRPPDATITTAGEAAAEPAPPPEAVVEPAAAQVAAVAAPVPEQPAAAPAPAPVVPIADGGTADGFALHLATVRDADAVGPEWQKLSRLFPQLANLAPRPAKAIEVPDKGTYWRVAAGSFATRDAAAAACKQLIAAGAWCQVTRP